MTKLAMLYKKSAKTGIIQQYSVEYCGITYTTRAGQVGGIQTPNVTTCTPKNIGRTNSTTAEEQAKLEAYSKHELQKKKGYTEDPSGKNTKFIPMKVEKYLENIKHHFLADSGNPYVGPKLNGVNGLFKFYPNGELKLHTNGGGEYPMIEHLKPEVLKVMELLQVNELNGELYKHGEWLEDITGAVKKHKPLTDKLEFHIFSSPDLNKTFEEANEIIEDAVHSLNLKSVFYIKHFPVDSKEEVEEIFDLYVNLLKFEGVMVVNPWCRYVYNIRSNDISKYKKMEDDEFIIVGYELDKHDTPVFHLQSKNATKCIFKARPEGTTEFKKSIIPIFESEYRGKWYKVKYEMIGKKGKPLKPIGVCLRDCLEDGTNII